MDRWVAVSTIAFNTLSLLLAAAAVLRYRLAQGGFQSFTDFKITAIRIAADRETQIVS
jgi:hypothetical protein